MWLAIISFNANLDIDSLRIPRSTMIDAKLAHPHPAPSPLPRPPSLSKG